MLNPRENMVVIDGIIKTVEIHSIQLSERGDKYNILFNRAKYKCYSYSRNKVAWLTNPVVFNPQDCHAYYKGRQLQRVTYIAAFRNYYHTYWFFAFADGKVFSFYDDDITLKKSCLADKQSKSVFEYLRRVAAINPLKSEDDGAPLLLRQYQGIDFIGDDRAAAPYLNPKEFQSQKFVTRPLIFPFGCNASQQKAVRAAFENQISIIQGPPGTGKTQTILNIVANIILQGKTVMVVSNNNSAIENVVEKMERYNMGFITAMLGSRANKDAFIAAQETEKLIPANIDQWHIVEADKAEYLQNLDSQSKALADVFAKQERLALARQELDALKVERTHFEQEVEYNGATAIRKQLSSAQLMTLWNELQAVVEGVRYSGIFAKLVNAIRDYRFRRRLHKIFSGVVDKPTLNDIVSLIPIVQRKFYEVKHSELVNEIASLGLRLKIDIEGYPTSVPAQTVYFENPLKFYKWWKVNEDKIYMTKREILELIVKINEISPKTLVKRHKELLQKKKI